MLSRRVREELRARILDGRLAPGVTLRERELADELGVSRVPVREALPWLELSGLVVLRPHRSAVVTAVHRRDVDELYDLRSALEPFIAGRAAASVRDGDPAKPLLDVVDAAGAALADGALDAFHRESSRFHGAVESIAGNELYLTTMGPLHDRSSRLNLANARSEPEVRHREHAAMAEAIAAGAVDLAAALALVHVERGRERTLATLRSLPAFVESHEGA